MKLPDKQWKWKLEEKRWLQVNEELIYESDGDALIRKQKKFFPLFSEALSIGDLTLVIHKEPKRRGLKQELWISAADLTDEMFSCFGKISLRDTDIGTIANYTHDKKTSYLEAIAIDKAYRNKGYCSKILSFLVTNAMNRGSETFVIQQILTEAEGSQYKNNRIIFEKIAETIVEKGLAKKFFIRENELNMNRLDLVIRISVQDRGIF